MGLQWDVLLLFPVYDLFRVNIVIKSVVNVVQIEKIHFISVLNVRVILLQVVSYVLSQFAS